jgi:hypothetical protein
LRIADAHTGATISSVTTNNLVYDLMKEAYFRKINVQVAYRDFGGINSKGSVAKIWLLYKISKSVHN